MAICLVEIMILVKKTLYTYLMPTTVRMVVMTFAMCQDGTGHEYNIVQDLVWSTFLYNFVNVAVMRTTLC